MDEYISRQEAIKALYEVYEHDYPTASGDFDEYARHDVRNVLNGLPSADVQPVKHEQRIDHEKLIGIFGTLCDYMVDNCRCDAFCPYADTKDENDECEAWRTIQKIRMDGDINDT